MRKAFLIGLGVAVLAAAVAVYIAVFNLDAIVKGLIEKYGSEAAGAKVQVGEVNLALSKGTATIRELTVANPPGYSANPAISLGEIILAIDTGTGVIKKIQTSGATVRLEKKKDTSNLQELKENIEKKDAPSGSAPPGRKKPGQKEEPKAPPTKIQIDLIQLQNTVVVISTPDGKEASQIKIDSLELKNLKGTPKEVAGQILGQLTQALLVSTVQKALKSTLENTIKKEGEKVGEFLQKLFK